MVVDLVDPSSFDHEQLKDVKRSCRKEDEVTSTVP